MNSHLFVTLLQMRNFSRLFAKLPLGLGKDSLPFANLPLFGLQLQLRFHFPSMNVFGPSLKKKV